MSAAEGREGARGQGDKGYGDEDAVQTGAPLLCKGEKVEYESIEYRRGADTGGGWQKRISGLRSRPSGPGYGLPGSGTGTGLNLHLMLNA